MSPALSHIIDLLTHYKYLVVFPLAVVEGPILSIVCGFVYKLGIFSFWPLYFVLVLADLVGDVLWYLFGYFFAAKMIRSKGHLVSLDQATMNRIAELFHKHQDKMLLISKMTMGLGFSGLTLITAGAVRVPLKRFVILNAIGGLVWSGLLIIVGYFFGNLFSAIDAGFRIIFLVALAVIIMLAVYGFRRYMKTKILKTP